LLDETYPVGVIKIDVEGAEAHVLRGAKEVISRDKPTLFVELHDGHPGTDPGLRQEVYGILRELGYDYHSININGEEYLYCKHESQVEDYPEVG